MAFLERFKGKTNNLTRDGIVSTVTTTSIPIAKKHDNGGKQKYASQPLEDHSMSTSKLKLVQLTKSPSVEEDFADITPNYSIPLNPRYAQRDEQQSPYRAPTDSYIYDRRVHTGPHPHSYTFSPNHRDLVNTYSGLRCETNFSQGNLDHGSTFPSKFGGGTVPNSVRGTLNEQSSGRLKAFFGHQYSQSHENSPTLKDRSNYSGSPKRDIYEEGNTQEARLSKFSFVERQKNMISKYKMREDREEERSYKSTGLSYSPEKASKLGYSK